MKYINIFVSSSLSGKKKNTHKEHKERREKKTYHSQWFLAISVDKNKLSKRNEKNSLMFLSVFKSWWQEKKHPQRTQRTQRKNLSLSVVLGGLRG
ncbi:MAG: hypothetical protein B7C24_02970 [Bacteroidetes bacterium 4572_77]|nr:MAG: hypothetical protein B7C24_02970 [Bacteroidetes bacterium 4572_77]